MCKKLSRKNELLLKLSRYSAEYETLEKMKVEYYEKHKKVTRTNILTLYHQQIYLDTLIKKICNLVDKLNKENILIDNEVALEVHRDFKNAIKMGLL